MLLAIDVGNTQTVLGIFSGSHDDAELLDHWRLATDARRTADELAFLVRGLLADHGIDVEAALSGIAVCSTVPAVLHEVRSMCARAFAGVPTTIVEPGVRTGVGVLIDNPKEAGADRIVNALAAHHLYGGPSIVVDFGTSTNFDVVSEK